MIRVLFALATFAVLAPIDAGPAAAQNCRPWCVHYSGRGGGGTNCGFTSLAQCRQTAQGADVCLPNSACPPKRQR